MYKLIAMDFDGTLLTDEKKVLKETKEKLLELKEEGYYIVGVTARNLESVKRVVSLDLFHYLILNNGAYQYNVLKKQGKYIGMISKEEISKIVRLMESKSKQIDLVSGNRYYIYKNKKNSSLSYIVDIDSIDEVKEECVRLNIFPKNQKDISILFELMRTKFPNLNTFFMQDSNATEQWLVVNPSGVDKSTTLENLGKVLGISLNEMIFFGDSFNDIEVIKKVGCGVAMKNALAEVKQNATYVTTTTNNENGIFLFLQNYLNRQ